MLSGGYQSMQMPLRAYVTIVFVLIFFCEKKRISICSSQLYGGEIMH